MRSQGVPRDSVTYSILMRAFCDASAMGRALGLLEQMSEEGHSPDEVVFNNLLAGCAVTGDAALARKLLEDMRGLFGVRPSNASFSILIKVYAKSKELGEALLLLQEMESKHGVRPEKRLFIQLVHAFLRFRSGREAVETYRLMCAQGNGAALEEENSKIIIVCTQFNMLEPATGFLTLML